MNTVMLIGGSDSCAGAGVQADLKTVMALGVYGTTVITAVTAQNTQGVQSVHAVPAGFVGTQIDSVMNDIGADVRHYATVQQGQLRGHLTVLGRQVL